MFKIWEFKVWKLVLAVTIAVTVIIVNNPIKVNLENVPTAMKYSFILPLLCVVIVCVSKLFSRKNKFSKTWK